MPQRAPFAFSGKGMRVPPRGVRCTKPEVRGCAGDPCALMKDAQAAAMPKKMAEVHRSRTYRRPRQPSTGFEDRAAHRDERTSACGRHYRCHRGKSRGANVVFAPCLSWGRT